jgi:hypothetical protein
MRVTGQMQQKKIEKILKSLKSCARKSGFIPLFWIDPPFWADLTKFDLKSCCW